MAFVFGFPEKKEPPVYKIKKPIRLIELFAGVGTQAMSLRDIGANFERYRVVEFDQDAINSYNAIHGTNFPVTDVRNVKGSDLGIVDKDKYEYLLTYSFPCTDLSLSGRREGMSREEWLKGNSTRSGMLWEVERILNECVDNAKNENLDSTTYLPQVMLMENVSQVHNPKNINDFNIFLKTLEDIGYKSYYKDLNARDFNIPQNRLRCYMVSILGDYSYKFPTPPGLTKKIDDLLESDVEKRFYVKKERNDQLVQDLKERGLIR